MKSNCKSPVAIIGIFLLAVMLFSSTAGIATAQESERNAIQINDDPSLWIIHAEITDKGVSVREDTEILLTIQNTGEDRKTGEIDLEDVNVSGGYGYFDFYVNNSPTDTLEYDLAPGERNRIELRVRGNRHELTTGDAVISDRGPHAGEELTIQEKFFESTVAVEISGVEQMVPKSHITEPNPQEGDVVQIESGPNSGSNGIVQAVYDSETYRFDVGSFELDTSYIDGSWSVGDTITIQNGHAYQGSNVIIQSDLPDKEDTVQVNPTGTVELTKQMVSDPYTAGERVSIVAQDSDHLQGIDETNSDYYEEGDVATIDSVNTAAGTVRLNGFSHTFSRNQISRTYSSESIDIRLDGELWIQLPLYNRGTSVGTNNITPAGERQVVTTSFDRFKDNSSGLLGAYSSNIPPVVNSGDGSFDDSSMGRVYNFFSAAETNDESMRLETGTEIAHRSGLYAQNLPDAEYYSLQFNYLIPPGSELRATDGAIEIRLVNSGGEEIDRETTYKLNNRGDRETRYFQLSEKENSFIERNQRLYLELESDETQQNDRVAEIYTAQILSSSDPLVTSSANLDIENIEILDGNGSVVTDNPTFETNELIQVQYEVRNTGSAVSDTQVSLYEDGTFKDTRNVQLNPNEKDVVTFSFTKQNGGIYYYSDPVEQVQRQVYVESDEAVDPIASITETASYTDGQLITDPTDPSTIALSGVNSFSPQGTIQIYRWDAGWLSSTQFGETTLVSTPSTQGTYDLLLEVEDDQGFSGTDVETVYAGTISPNANLTAPTEASSAEAVGLSAEGTTHPDPYRCIEEYRWKVDGTVVNTNSVSNCESQSPSPTTTITFDTGGAKDVQLVAVDDLGNQDTDTQTINVDGVKPTAQFTTDPSTTLTETPVSFDASDSFSEIGRDIVEYEWDFDDGDTATGETVSHSFSGAGVYSVTLTVTDSVGETGTISKQIEVQDEPFRLQIDGPDVVDTSESPEYTYTENSTGINNLDSTEWRVNGELVATNTSTIIESFEGGPTGDVTIEVQGSSDEYDYTDSAQKTITVTGSDPIADIRASFEDGEVMYLGEQISYDGSESYDPDGTDLSYEWSVADYNESRTGQYVDLYRFDSSRLPENSTDETVIFNREEYDVLGYHTTTLTVTDANGRTDTATHEVGVVNRGPDPGLDLQTEFYEQNIYTEEELENFEDKDTNVLTYLGSNWTWQFEEGSRHWEEPNVENVDFSYNFEEGPSGSNPTSNHTWDDESLYTELPDGTYYAEFTIDLTVEGELGKVENVSFPVRVEVPPLKADLEADPQNVFAREESVELDASDTTIEPYAIEEYEYTFGDGETVSGSNLEVVNHEYQAVGTFQTQVRVTDFLGRVDTAYVAVRARAEFNEALFLACGLEDGPTGPTQSQCDSAYAGTYLENWVEVDQGIQEWTVPKTGRYRVQAAGAQGGGPYGGEGAVIQAEFDIDAGTDWRVLAGLMGDINATTFTSGGGGTFIADANNNPIMVAGGGGGATGPGTAQNGNIGNSGIPITAGKDPRGDSVYVGSNTGRGRGGTGGSGGSNCPTNGCSEGTGSGAGFYGDGDTFGRSEGAEAKAFTDPNRPGEGGQAFSDGGFGGGGVSIEDIYDRAGGGGGYSGGGAVTAYNFSGNWYAQGGGGGSYIPSGASQVETGLYYDSEYSPERNQVSNTIRPAAVGTGYVDVELVEQPEVTINADVNGNPVSYQPGDDPINVNVGDTVTIDVSFDGKNNWVLDYYYWYFPGESRFQTGQSATESYTFTEEDTQAPISIIVEGENSEGVVLNNDLITFNVNE